MLGNEAKSGRGATKPQCAYKKKEKEEEQIVFLNTPLVSVPGSFFFLLLRIMSLFSFFLFLHSHICVSSFFFSLLSLPTELAELDTNQQCHSFAHAFSSWTFLLPFKLLSVLIVFPSFFFLLLRIFQVDKGEKDVKDGTASALKKNEREKKEV